MIPIENNKNITEHGLDAFQRQAFSIAVTKESFQILLTGIYSQKIRAVVRELWTNAYDSHAFAGKADVAFDCHLPSLLDATFSVRDFGTGMTHEEVMHSYTQVFTSTKTTTNEQVGEKGLGSKVVFAYCDSSELETFLEGVKRTYLVSLDPEGIPSISFILAEETDEPNGVRVSFPVQTRHYQEFVMEAEDLAMAFPVRPNISGASVRILEPTIQFENWKWYDSHSGQRYMIEQGCVRYPLDNDNRADSGCVRAGTLVVKVPIGSVATAASREALALTDKTQEYLTVMFRELQPSIDRYVGTALEGCKTYLDAIRTAMVLKGTFAAKTATWYGKDVPMVGRGNMNYGMKQPLQLYYVERVGREIREILLKSPEHCIYDFPSITFYVDRGQKIARRKIRLDALRERSFVRHGTTGNFYILKDPTSRQLKTLVRTWGLQPHQIKSITAVPDVPAATRESVVRSGIYSYHHNDLTSAGKVDFGELDEFYVIPMTKIDSPVHFRQLDNAHVYPKKAHFVVQVSKTLGLSNVYFLLPQAYKQLDGAGVLWEDAVVEKVMDMKDELLTQYEERMLRCKFADWLVPILETCDLLPAKTSSAAPSALISHSNIMQMFQTDLFQGPTLGVNDINAKVAAVSEAINERFPLLQIIDMWRARNDSNCTENVKQYIQLIQEKEGK